MVQADMGEGSHKIRRTATTDATTRRDKIEIANGRRNAWVRLAFRRSQ
jgi:hypothetical protein